MRAKGFNGGFGNVNNLVVLFARVPKNVMFPVTELVFVNIVNQNIDQELIPRINH